jgi:hypothetical protein
MVMGCFSISMKILPKQPANIKNHAQYQNYHTDWQRDRLRQISINL